MTLGDAYGKVKAPIAAKKWAKTVTYGLLPSVCSRWTEKNKINVSSSVRNKITLINHKNDHITSDNIFYLPSVDHCENYAHLLSEFSRQAVLLRGAFCIFLKFMSHAE